jgi:hypothetical protein
MIGLHSYMNAQSEEVQKFLTKVPIYNTLYKRSLNPILQKYVHAVYLWL